MFSEHLASEHALTNSSTNKITVAPTTGSDTLLMADSRTRRDLPFFAANNRFSFLSAKKNWKRFEGSLRT